MDEVIAAAPGLTTGRRQAKHEGGRHYQDRASNGQAHSAGAIRAEEAGPAGGRRPDPASHFPRPPIQGTAGKVTRLAGTDRYSTRRGISKDAFDPGIPDADVATGVYLPKTP